MIGVEEAVVRGMVIEVEGHDACEDLGDPFKQNYDPKGGGVCVGGLGRLCEDYSVGCLE